MEVEQRVSRGGFIRRMGKLAAIGLGVSLVPAQAARAQSSYCCRDPECGVDLCGSGYHGYKCWDNCSGGSTCCVGCVPSWGHPCQYQLTCPCL